MLDSSAFTYEPYIDNRVKSRPGFSVGTSGQLLLATHKDNGKKYLVKHTYPHNAANEFVSCWLAEKLGVPAPRAFLLSPNEVFLSRYTVAIEFIEGFRNFSKAAVPEELQADLIAQFAFNSLIGSDDAMQLNATGEHIYSYDFSEAFYISDDLLYNLLSRNEDAGIDLLRQKFASFRQHISFQDFDIPGLAKEFHLDPDKQKSGMIATAKKVLNISEEEIMALSDELMEMYPAAIAVYYEECIKAMQDWMKQF